jgi:class 3 adenylate cyclase
MAMSDKNLKLVVENLTTGHERPSIASLVVTPEGAVISGSEELNHLYGESGITGGNNLFVTLPDPALQDAFLACVHNQNSVSCNLRLEEESGKKRWFRMMASPGRDSLNGRICVTLIEISEFIFREQELSEQNRKMAGIARQVEKANALLEIQKGEINQQKVTIEAEKEKSEHLLLNILPHEVARQLKSKGKAGTREYKQVSVLFTDFKSFSTISKELNPNELVGTLDAYFARFDEIAMAHYLEKIKTIGDSYMCAGGLPLSNRSNPIDAVLVGLEMQHYVQSLHPERIAEQKTLWELRIGIHTGPVIAGVIGKKRFAYDIWGDTVNIASRMEQSGQTGMVNISGTTYELIRDYFICDYRGKVETKNMGKIEMYFVKSIKPEYALDETGILPNDRMISLVNKL